MSLEETNAYIRLIAWDYHAKESFSDRGRKILNELTEKNQKVLLAVLENVQVKAEDLDALNLQFADTWRHDTFRSTSDSSELFEKVINYKTPETRSFSDSLLSLIPSDLCLPLVDSAKGSPFAAMRIFCRARSDQEAVLGGIDVQKFAKYLNSSSYVFLEELIRNQLAISDLDRIAPYLTKFSVDFYREDKYMGESSIKLVIGALKAAVSLTSLCLEFRNARGIEFFGPCRTLTQLKVLQLNDEGCLAEEDYQNLSLLENLEELSIGYVRGVSLSGIRSLTKLQKLDFSGGLIFERHFVNLTFLTSLKELHLNSIGVKDSVLTALQNLTNLEILDLSYNKAIGGDRLEHIQNLEKLQDLNFSNCLISTEDALKSLENLTLLKRLNLTSNPIQAKDLKYLSTLSELEELRLAKCSINSLDPLPILNNLTSVTFDFNPIKDLSGIGKICNVKYLDLRFCDLSDESSEPIQYLSCLEKLNLSKNGRLTPAVFKYFKPLTQLNSLQLPEQFTDDETEEAKDLKLHLPGTEIFFHKVYQGGMDVG